MTFTMIVHCDNDAFHGNNGAPELTRIVREAADRVERGGLLYGKIKLSDINGNQVGHCLLTRE